MNGYWWLQFEKERILLGDGPALSAENFAFEYNLPALLDSTNASLWTGQPHAGGTGFLKTPTITLGLWNSVAVNSRTISELVVHLRGSVSDATLSAKLYGDDGQLLEEATKRIYTAAVPVAFQFSTMENVAKAILQVERANTGFFISGLEVYTAPYTLNVSHVRESPITEDIDPFCLELPANEVSFTFSDGREHVFVRRQPFEVYAYDYDSQTLRFIGKFYIKNSYLLFGTTYNVSATDAVGLLTIPGVPERYVSDATFMELVSQIVGGETHVSIPDELKSRRLRGILEAGDKRSQLLQICAAANAICDTSGNGALTFRSLKTRADELAIPSDRVYIGGELSWEDKKTGIVLARRSFTVLESEDADGYSEIRKINDGENRITLGINSEAITVTDPQDQSQQAEQTEDWSGNYLQLQSGLSEVLKRALLYLQSVRRYQVKILWNGELPGDYVSVPTQDGKLVKGNIIRMDFVLSAKIAADIEILVDAVVNVENGMEFVTKDGIEYQTKAEPNSSTLGIIY